MIKKKTFFERITGSVRLEDDEQLTETSSSKKFMKSKKEDEEDAISTLKKEDIWDQDAELTVDIYQTPSEIVVQTMVAGVQPDNLSINITRDMITIRGKREENRSINQENYYTQELYWGSFSRTISLPEEVDPEEAEAIEKHGLLIIKLPKINKNKQTNLKVKSI